MRALSISILLMSLSVPALPAAAQPKLVEIGGCHEDRSTGAIQCRQSSVPNQTMHVGGGSGLSFRNCAEARAAGVAPITRGQPGYALHLDRDRDGIACEPYRGR